MTIPTRPSEHLPATRYSREEVTALAQAFATQAMVEVLNSLPMPTMVVTDTRQVIYANKPALDLIESGTVEELFGLRIGEALGCAYPDEASGGCGTTKFCRYCGLANAIVASLSGEPATQECLIQRKSERSPMAYNLQVWSKPAQLGGQPVVVNSLLDVGHEKKLQFLEKIFFHDLLNVANAVMGVGQVLSRQMGNGLQPSVGILLKAAERLTDMIHAQQEFARAERSEYATSPSGLDSHEVALELMHLVAGQTFTAGKTVALASDFAQTNFSSDRRLLGRVLHNMLKNALEASAPGETVTIGCHSHAHGLAFWMHNNAVMSEEVQCQLFKRAFSTKGEGRGMGTYSMKLFAERYLDGDITFTSAPGQGTIFTLRLPRHLSEAPAEKMAPLATVT